MFSQRLRFRCLASGLYVYFLDPEVEAVGSSESWVNTSSITLRINSEGRQINQ
jgi:hypothetical protein